MPTTFCHQLICSQVKNKETATSLRNHIITDIAFSNGERTGALIDLNIMDFSAAVKTHKGFIVMVDHGETYKTYGASNIFLTKMQTKFIQRFIHEYSVLFTPQTDQLFCKVNGHRSDVGDVGRYLLEAWTAFHNIVI